MAKIITKATGPLVNIPNARNNQGIIQILSSSLEILLQKERRLTPKVAHKRESLTAVLLQMIINGDKTKLSEAISESGNLSLEFSVEQNKVSAITIIKSSVDKAEGSLADKEPNLSQFSLAGME